MAYPTNRGYCISYDLRAADKDYEGLFEAIKKSPAWWHYLESTWLIVTNESPNEIWDRLQPHVDSNDYLLVIEVRKNSQGWLPEEAWDWIKESLPQ